MPRPDKPVRSRVAKHIVRADQSPPLEFIATDETAPQYKMLIFGHSKTGKSFMAGDAQNVPEMAPVLCVGFGEGVSTFIGERRFNGIQIVKPQSLDALSKLYNWLRPDWDGDNSGFNKLEEFGWRTILLDDLDRLYDILMRERMATVIAEKAHREEFKPALDDYGVVRQQMLAIVDWFLALPVHVIMTCWAEKSKDASDERDKLMPSLPGKLANDLAGRFGIVTYLEYSLPRRRAPNASDDPQGTRLAHFSSTNSFIAGVWGESRLQRLGAEMESPTMNEIFNRLQGEN